MFLDPRTTFNWLGMVVWGFEALVLVEAKRETTALTPKLPIQAPD